ncbi:TPA: N-acetyltransferase [candidate division CPR2 bacterium]|uniref:Transferase hexapeptide repeat containing protein n=1 Tax=candidate division CPR2 bacterium GW2011_GWC1_41_48 TaxID=1618344 RepID=A0A0G0W9D4_UNCC2|nr:MAG: hypothetical protein UT47_C0007G0004 [candidate division CPR2 bacterium GW2011_GWC2_39_35]KKR28751.1 MAG: hypothetical protein UT60_C0013G0018 [candidate division CPR2 bacterium GW2011_GWD2_39_7]KKS08662.1 MAG: hypothetical protein UU65_C0006G0032 [candidate division CPR2 bacterium GW2011_GWC1_41_48]OGB73141.1 MAG: transferase [candidate division CPR2 bacterium GWD2_39_7]HBG81388.1 N-acetyltransferase [candidate division CPR2 bacterium]
MSDIRVHATADVSKKTEIGENSQVWNGSQIREGAKIGKNCILGKNVYVDFDVKIGDSVKIQNNSSVFHGVTVEDGVFIGPHVCLTNDKVPRAVNPDFSLKDNDDWTVSEIKIMKGASIGASSVILPGVKVGEFALVGAGSVVTKDVPDYGLVMGNPARLAGYVCKCGLKIGGSDTKGELKCKSCGQTIKLK